ncbi:MAG: 3D domain-containing protein [Flavonifractor plautii]
MHSAAGTEPKEPEWIEYEATAYCSCEKCCGSWALNRPDGIVYTASGAVAEQGVTIAADWDVLPPGTVIYIDGLGERVVRIARFGAYAKGNAVMTSRFEDHDEALVSSAARQSAYIIDVTEENQS